MRGISARQLSASQISDWRSPRHIVRSYASDPREGIVKWLATAGGTRTFVNPQGASGNGNGSKISSGGLVESEASSILNSIYPSMYLTDDNPGTFCITLNVASSWIWLSTGVFEFAPTHISLQQRSDSSTQLYGNLTIAVSNDASAWTNVGSISSPTQTTSAWNVAALTAPGWWRYIRALQTGLTNTSDNYLCIGEFELFGELRLRTGILATM